MFANEASAGNIPAATAVGSEETVGNPWRDEMFHIDHPNMRRGICPVCPHCSRERDRRHDIIVCMKRCVRLSEYLPLAACVFALMAQPLVVLAQDVPPRTFGQPTAAAPANMVNCFDYYHFGSVQVDVTPSVASAVSGVPITFTGKIKNANPYPVVDGSVYVKIFRQRGSGEKDANGPDVVDQFYGAEGLTVPANGELPISINWNIPSYVVSGEYKVATFFTVSRKFNLLGLPFTDDVVGNTASFKVSGELTKGVSFKKDAVMVAGEKYYFAAFPPRTSATDPVTVVATLANPTGESVTVPVTWSLYHWSQNDQANFITQKSEQVIIPAGKNAKVSFVVDDTNYPVYLLQGVAKWHDSSSIINVRFVREGKDQLRINFPSVMSYPLTAGSQATLFSCLHNAGASDSVPGGKLELSLLDQNGKVIHSYTYTGDVTGAMMGVAEKFTPEKTYGTFALDAKLYQGDALVDQSSVTYDCQKLDPTACPTESAGPTTSTTTFIFGGLAALVALGGLAYVVKRRRTWRSEVESGTSSTSI